jgi:hypothetical protein
MPDRGAERLLAEGDARTPDGLAPIPPADWEQLRAPADRGALSEVAAAAADAIVAVAIGARDRGEPVRDDHPFRAVLADVGRTLSAPAWQMFGADRGRVEVAPEIPYAVLVGLDLTRRTTVREQRFLFGRAAARLRSRSCLAETFPSAALAGWITAASRTIIPSYAGSGPVDEEVVRALAKALARKARRALEPAARALPSLLSPADVETWRAAAAASADRAGLVLCGHVPSALAVLLRDPGGRAPEGAEAIAAARARPDALALLAFAASEEHFLLRQRLRSAIA